MSCFGVAIKWTSLLFKLIMEKKIVIQLNSISFVVFSPMMKTIIFKGHVNKLLMWELKKLNVLNW